MLLINTVLLIVNLFFKESGKTVVISCRIICYCEKTCLCIHENKGADQLHSNTAQLISLFVFATYIVQSLYFLNPKFQANSHLL